MSCQRCKRDVPPPASAHGRAGVEQSVLRMAEEMSIAGPWQCVNQRTILRIENIENPAQRLKQKGCVLCWTGGGRRRRRRTSHCGLLVVVPFSPLPVQAAARALNRLRACHELRDLPLLLVRQRQGLPWYQ